MEKRWSAPNHFNLRTREIHDNRLDFMQGKAKHAHIEWEQFRQQHPENATIAVWDNPDFLMVMSRKLFDFKSTTTCGANYCIICYPNEPRNQPKRRKVEIINLI
jgi:hypothetical protein